MSECSAIWLPVTSDSESIGIRSRPRKVVSRFRISFNDANCGSTDASGAACGLRDIAGACIQYENGGQAVVSQNMAACNQHCTTAQSPAAWLPHRSAAPTADPPLCGGETVGETAAGAAGATGEAGTAAAGDGVRRAATAFRAACWTEPTVAAAAAVSEPDRVWLCGAPGNFFCALIRCSSSSDASGLPVVIR